MASGWNSERVQRSGLSPEGEVESLGTLPAPVAPGGDALTQAKDLIAQVAEEELGAPRQALALRINGALAGLAAGTPSEGNAAFILDLLEKGSLGELVDSQGRSCRSTAVRALFQMGYPHALEVSPEDLDHLRFEERVVPRLKLLAGVLAYLGVAASGVAWAGEFGLSGLPSLGLKVGALVLAGLVGLGALGRRRLGVGVFVGVAVASAASLVLGLDGLWALVGSGGALLLLLAAGRSALPPGALFKNGALLR